MKAKSVAVLLVASAASLAVPCFAGSYGQASQGRECTGVPVRHHAQTAHTKVMKEGQGSAVDGMSGGVGGDETGHSQSGRRAPSDSIDATYRGG
ncbi:hypothetical protein AWB81_04617 [Caballeronia arationis]|jgi:hypothetical protein|uniref:Lipoprotein n=1 Tax=Caballeronia arationis TaxID=1777142 RepID=A0A7Z7IDR6_9BURK|nr:hypothetical protein [Caballeronia arationis]SAK88098.1 hypothetical protein AWB81_04617 [Caballeronia arationis]SOE88854.1 hypothetical protein SAMN05446927_7480 [Caballeronia arationis]